MNPKEVQIALVRKFKLPDGSYPLRKQCPNLRKFPGFHDECTDCADGWLYNDSPGVLTDAIREKGWSYDIVSSDPTGDRVLILTGDRPSIGRCMPDDGLRFPAALELAALRAVEATKEN